LSAGLTDVEIELAMSRSQTSAVEDHSSPVADRGPPPPPFGYISVIFLKYSLNQILALSVLIVWK